MNPFASIATRILTWSHHATITFYFDSATSRPEVCIRMSNIILWGIFTIGGALLFAGQPPRLYHGIWARKKEAKDWCIVSSGRQEDIYRRPTIWSSWGLQQACRHHQDIYIVSNDISLSQYLSSNKELVNKWFNDKFLNALTLSKVVSFNVSYLRKWFQIKDILAQHLWMEQLRSVVQHLYWVIWNN